MNKKINIDTDFYGIDFGAYRKKVATYVNELISRAGKPGQFLNWIDLPGKQISKIDDFYNLAEKFKNATKNTKLTVLGIGGSKHPIEHMLSINGLNLNNEILFYSDIDSLSFKRLLKSLDNDVTTSNFLVVSKSGSTFETNDAFLSISPYSVAMAYALKWPAVIAFPGVASSSIQP